MSLRTLALAFGILPVFLCCQSPAGEAAAQPLEIPMKNVLVIRSLGRPGRSAVHVDALEARMVMGQWRAPQAGDVVVGPGGSEQRWEAAAANEQGALDQSATRGGYVFWPAVSDREQILLLEAAGHGCVYVNGEIRGGDSYGNGYLRLPVQLRAGTNEFLFQCARGGLRARLIAPPGPLSIHTADSTLPDLIAGEAEPVWGAVVLLNATASPLRASLRVLEKGSLEQWVQLPPLGIFKAPFLVPPPARGLSNSCAVTLEACAWPAGAPSPVRAQVSLRVRQPDQTHVRTFISQIDGSVQYYAVNPAPSSLAPQGPPALFLSLHGAGVEARGQAESCHPKSWGHIVCPTNRRPYGFDWEEWGRWDALEVLGLAKARYQADPSRIYLTGHSMGGHGTWQLGVLFPDQFAALGPSAGWISFRSYANPSRSPATNAMQQMLQRAAAASDTLLMATNYLQEGVYILHGDADDNVPVTEAREMRRVLGQFHRDFDFHEQPKAGHWWDASDEPGTDCVDWAPMFDFFARRTIPADESVRRIRFATVNPAVSSRSHWVGILAQEHPLELSAVDVRCDPGQRRIAGVTTNVARLWLGFPAIPPGPGVVVDLDGQKLAGLTLPAPAGHAAGSGPNPNPNPSHGLCLVREAGRWQVGEYPPATMKQPARSGPFREVFRNRVVLAYGTQGTPAENAWALAKARYDAETFYYRGNASLELVADVDLVARQRGRQPGRAGEIGLPNVVVYGHAEGNAAWAFLLARSPVQAHRGRLQVGGRELAGEGLGCLFLQPHPLDPGALVGVVCGSGMPGMRVTERMPYFLSGPGFPDCLVIDAELPAKGLEGVRAAGFFGQDWQVNTGEFVWRD